MPKTILILSTHYITIYAFRRELVARMRAPRGTGCTSPRLMMSGTAILKTWAAP